MNDDPRPLRRDFGSRDDLRDYLAGQFPAAAAVDGRLSPFVGGRAAAERQLDRVRPAKYAKTRNMIDGDATKLSPYIRHRVLSLAEVRDAALQKVDKPYQAKKLLQELAWHDYFQRVYQAVGEKGIWQDMEPWKTGYGPADYAETLPRDVAEGTTGVDFVNSFVRELNSTGYLHNHARLWLACYVVHVRRVRWQAGARWFLQHLVDGDPASNNLSWQWAASTFGGKPYFMNRGNVVKFSGDRFPPHDPNDPLDAGYEELEGKLFAHGPDATQDAGRGLDIDLKKSSPRPPDAGGGRGHGGGQGGGGKGDGRRVAWVHGDMLRPDHPALRGADSAVFVFDDAALRDAGTSLKPVGFVYECLLEMPDVTILRGEDVAAAVRAFAAGHGAGDIVTGDSPSPAVTKIARGLGATVAAAEPFVEIDGPLDLKRFSRYWRLAEKALKRAGRL